MSTEFTPRERRLIARLKTPSQVQAYLNRLPYNYEKGGETLRGFRGVVEHGQAHCLEAALFAAVVLERHGYLWLGGRELAPSALPDMEWERDGYEHRWWPGAPASGSPSRASLSGEGAAA